MNDNETPGQAMVRYVVEHTTEHVLQPGGALPPKTAALICAYMYAAFPQHWELMTTPAGALLVELDTKLAPDSDYRAGLSSYARVPLEKGETWRDRLLKVARTGLAVVAIAIVTLNMATTARAEDMTVEQLKSKVCAGVSAWADYAKVTIREPGHVTVSFECGTRPRRE